MIFPVNNRRPLVDKVRELSAPMQPEPTGMDPSTGDSGTVKAVLFDIYGTLLCSGSGDIGHHCAVDSLQAMHEALSSVCDGPVSAETAEDASARYRAEIQADHAAARENGVQFPEVDILSVWERILRGVHAFEVARDRSRVEMAAVIYECMTNPVWPMPGMQQTLEQLSRVPLRLGIVSNAQFYTPLVLEAFTGQALESLGFSPELCAWSYELREAKPSTALFAGPLRVLEAEGIHPRDTLYVGNDMLNDVWTASEAGCRTVLFAGDRRSLRLREAESRCKLLKPDFVVTALDQVVDMLAP